MTVLRTPPPPSPKTLNSPSSSDDHPSKSSEPDEIQPSHPQPPPLPSPSSSAALPSDFIFTSGVSRRRTPRVAVNRVLDISPRASNGKLLAVGSICRGIEGLEVGCAGSMSDEVNVNGKRKLNPAMDDSPVGELVDEYFEKSENCLGLSLAKRVLKTVKQEIGVDITSPRANVDGFVEERRVVKDNENKEIDLNVSVGAVKEEMTEECSRIDENDCTKTTRNRFTRKEKGKWITDDDDNHAIDLNVRVGVEKEEIKEECSRVDKNDCTKSTGNRFTRKEKGKWIADDKCSNGNEKIVSHYESNNEVWLGYSPVQLEHQNYQNVSERPKGIVIEEGKTKLVGASYSGVGNKDANGYSSIEKDDIEQNGVGELTIAEALLTLSENFIGDPSFRNEYYSREDNVSGIAHLEDDGSQRNDRQDVEEESSSEEEVQENVFATLRGLSAFEISMRKRTALGLARCLNEGDSSSQNVKAEGEDDVKELPGPFSTAMGIASDRANGIRVGINKSLKENSCAPVEWIPKKNKCDHHSQSSPPSLRDLCLWVLAKNADAISSLEFVPDTFRHKLSRLLCYSRKMNNRFLNLLLCDSPTEVCLWDCSWLSEEEFEKSFQGCDTSQLLMLQLDQCGRCILDYVMLSTLASLPALRSLSLRGACRLSDVGIAALVSSAPALQSLNLSQCSFLTFSSIHTIANSLGSTLKELYLDDCLNIDPILMAPAMKKLQHLEVLSIAGIEDVCDRFFQEFLTDGGRNLKELILTNCVKLTNKSIRAISENCYSLRAISLMNLSRVTDYSLCCLATGCPAIQKLKLSRNQFSDEAVAAFLEISKENLKELSLNNVRKVSRCTAVSLACFSKNLVSLDLSWCRKLTNEDLGLIVDNCPSLKVLKLFGCPQVTDVFLDGHSNAEVEIIGLKLSPVWQPVESHSPYLGPS